MNESKITEEDFSKFEKWIDAHKAEYDARPRREICGVEVTGQGDKTRLYALCDVCEENINPPSVKKNVGAAGVRTCDWCGAVNAL